MAGFLACSASMIAAQACADTELSFGFSADGYIAESDMNGSDSYVGLYPEFTLTTTADSGWSVEAYLAPELYTSSNDEKEFGADDPYTFSSLTITTPGGLSFGAEYESTYLRETEEFFRDAYALFIESDAIGRLAYGDIDSAVGFSCITAPGGTTNFAADDLTNFGSCESFGFQSTLLYNTPDFNGYTVYASLSNPPDEDLSAGDPSRTFSLALAYAGDVSGNSLEYTIGFERVTDYFGTPDHGGAHATVVQAGATYGIGDLIYSASGSAQFYEGTDTTQFGLALGLDWQATDRLLIGGGVTRAQVADFSTADFSTEHQTTYGLSAEYAVIPDRLTLDIGASRLSAPSGDDTLIGAGFSVSF
ncbi:hypothetical protein [Roseivivax halotolerans]|nr:hypothetical protein [Roseivivax halotolerans]